LRAAIVTLLLVSVLIWLALGLARAMERRDIYTVAPMTLTQKSVGTALQREAFRHSDLLPIYGSSELQRADPYHPSKVFERMPTGFAVFPIPQVGTCSLLLFQRLAAIGPALQGRKVAVSLTPGLFFARSVGKKAYAGDFSRLQATEFTFSSQLTWHLKQAAARRMLDYPDTLENDLLLKFALGKLADGSTSAKLLYCAVWPLGKLQTVILRLQDHFETLRALFELKATEELRGGRESMAWIPLVQEAEHRARERADSNPFGFDNSFWRENSGGLTVQKHADPRAGGMHPMVGVLRFASLDENECREWRDLELLLRGLHELGAHVLLLRSPLCGPYCDFVGVPEQTRHAFHEKLQALALIYGAQVMDFAEHDHDRDFVLDIASHLSSKGWIYYDRALDEFYHDAPLTRELAATPIGKGQPSGPANPDLAEGPALGTDGVLALYQGNLDRVDCARITGWVWDLNHTNTAVSVAIYDDDHLLATVVANQFRKDLAEAHKGTGNCGFQYLLPATLKDGRVHSIRVKVARTPTELMKSPVSITCKSGANQLTAPARPEERSLAAVTTPGAAQSSHPEGTQDSADCKSVSGWAFDKSHPEQILHVDVYVDGFLLATTPADRFRPDLLNAGKGDGKHGFSMPLPEKCRDGKAHSINVSISGTSVILKHSPRTITCPPK
jgi:D-alanine transfer protein